MHSNSHQGFAGQPEAIPTWQMEKLILREGNDLPKVTHPDELEANLELGYVSSHSLLFSLQSGCPHLVCSDSESHSTTVRQEEKLQTEGHLLPSSLGAAPALRMLYYQQQPMAMQSCTASSLPGDCVCNISFAPSGHIRKGKLLSPLQLKKLRLKDTNCYASIELH